MHEQGWPVTVSIGAVTYDQPDLAAEPMLKEADQLMYESKKSGKNRIRHIHKKTD